MSLAQIKAIPERISKSEVLQILKSNDVNWKYIKYVKDLTNIKDELLAEWLSVNVKTFRSYKKENAELKQNIQEKIVLLISLFKHGHIVFGSIDEFYNWLDSDNFFQDKEKPINYLMTVTGIRFVYDRLTAIEYGDNV